MRLLLVILALFAAPPPPRMELRVTAFDTRPGAVAETEIDLSLSSANGPVTVLVPAGYLVDLARRPGAVVGSATVTVKGVRRSALLLAAPGSIWTASTLQVAAARDRLTFTPPAAATEIELDLQGVLTNPASPTIAVWRAVADDVEARSVVPLPQRLGLRAAFASGRLTLRGRLTAAGRPRPGINVHLGLGADLAEAREIGVARTRADGSFVLSDPSPARPFTALAYVNVYDASCAPPCVSETVAPPPTEVVAVALPPHAGQGFPNDRAQTGDRILRGRPRCWRCARGDGGRRDRAAGSPPRQPREQLEQGLRDAVRGPAEAGRDALCRLRIRLRARGLQARPRGPTGDDGRVAGRCEELPEV